MNIALLVDVGPAGKRCDISAVQGVHSPRDAIERDSESEGSSDDDRVAREEEKDEED